MVGFLSSGPGELKIGLLTEIEVSIYTANRSKISNMRPVFEIK